MIYMHNAFQTMTACVLYSVLRVKKIKISPVLLVFLPLLLWHFKISFPYLLIRVTVNLTNLTQSVSEINRLNNLCLPVFNSVDSNVTVEGDKR